MPREDGSVLVYNKTKQTFLARRLKVADSVLSRFVGLLGKRRLEPDGGLWIFPSRGIHTLGMLFRIDVVFLDRGLRVVALRESIPPFSMTSLYLDAESVIELPARTISRTGTEVGDQLVISAVDVSGASESTRPAIPSKAGE
ncbi:MAG: DUF192 domain-containing protein [Terriglobia bacterium]